MLAASSSAPNSQPDHSPGPTPTPGNWRGVTNGMAMARKAIESNNLDQAERILYELLEFAPVETKAWKLLARTQRTMGHIQQGIASATRALQLQKVETHKSPPASSTLARLLWQQGEHKQASDMLATLLEMQPENGDLIELKRMWEKENVT